MTLAGWLARAQSAEVAKQIADDPAQEDFQAIIHVAVRLPLDWETAVALLHMVYGWMPTMLRPIEIPDQAQRDRLVAHLQRVKDGQFLDRQGLAEVQHFANRSIVGASKLLHVLAPKNYVIWDSRVADVYLWSGVTLSAYSTADRYVEYLAKVHEWAKEQAVQDQCIALRQLNPALADASDPRMIELVLFCKG